MRVVSLAWGPKYRALVPRFRASFEAAGFLVSVCELDGPGPSDGRAAWRMKPGILGDALDQDGAPVLWADIDCLCRRPADLLRAVDPDRFDFACAPERPTTWNTAVLLALPTGRARQALAVWEGLMKGPPQNWGNDALTWNEATRATRARIAPLPAEYGWVDAWHRNPMGNRQVVIEANAS